MADRIEELLSALDALYRYASDDGCPYNESHRYQRPNRARLVIETWLQADTPVPAGERREGPVVKALRELTEACERDLCSPATDVFGDDESVGGGDDGDCAVTFGMIRRALLAALPAARPEPHIAEPDSTGVFCTCGARITDTTAHSARPEPPADEAWEELIAFVDGIKGVRWTPGHEDDEFYRGWAVALRNVRDKIDELRATVHAQEGPQALCPAPAAEEEAR